MNTRPVSIAHLVFGLIFLGASVLWAIGAGTGADAPDMALMAPIVLIGAGVIGLVGIVVNGRNARRRQEALLVQAAPDTTPEYAATGISHEEDPS
jgi:hypothetical protein